MPLHAEVCVAFALPIALPEGFDERALSAMMTNLGAYEPTVSSSAAAASQGEEGSESKKARVTSSIFDMDGEKEYPKIKYHDAVESYEFDGPLMKAFEKAATKILGKDHDVSVVLQERFGKKEDPRDEPNYAMYLIDKPSMLTAGEHVQYDEIRIPCEWGLDFADIPIDQVDAVKTKEHFERLCRALGLEKKKYGNAGWKLIASMGEKWERF
jgi:hypothetical protein